MSKEYRSLEIMVTMATVCPEPKLVTQERVIENKDP